MKFFALVFGQHPRLSHPARGAWIEITVVSVTAVLIIRSHPARGAWIEIS